MHTHTFSRWIKGRHTGQWFRHCLCGECERSETPPAECALPPPPPFTLPEIGRSAWCPACGITWDRVRCSCGFTEAEDYAQASVVREGPPPVKFNRFAMGKQLRGRILDWRAKQSGERE